MGSGYSCLHGWCPPLPTWMESNHAHMDDVYSMPILSSASSFPNLTPSPSAALAPAFLWREAGCRRKAFLVLSIFLLDLACTPVLALQWKAGTHSHLLLTSFLKGHQACVGLFRQSVPKSWFIVLSFSPCRDCQGGYFTWDTQIRLLVCWIFRIYCKGKKTIQWH